MSWPRDITGLDNIKQGTFRSLNGAADESIFQGRASKAGFFCFFKVWRDMPYDAILDYEGNLLRIEVKGTSGSSVNVTRGTRSGQQILRGTSRTRTLTRTDCDFCVGVDSENGDCYIIPEDVIEIIDNNSLTRNAVEVFKEKWKLFMHQDAANPNNYLTKEETRDGIRGATNARLNNILAQLGVPVPSVPLKIPGTQKKLTNQTDAMIYTIWSEIAKRL